MNPLYLSEFGLCLKVNNRDLVVENARSKRLIGQWHPRSFPYDSVVIEGRANLSTEAIKFLISHSVDVIILDWDGHILTAMHPPPPSGMELRMAQYSLSQENREKLVRAIINEKIRLHNQLLTDLSKYYNFDLQRGQEKFRIDTQDIRLYEARCAEAFFCVFGTIVTQLGFDWSGRVGAGKNMNAGNLPNACLNFSYGVTEAYIRRAVNAVGLDPFYPYLHQDIGKEGFLFDLVEPWRAHATQASLETLEEVASESKRVRREYSKFSPDYKLFLTSKTKEILIEKLNLQFTNSDILNYVRGIANFILKPSYDWNLSICDVKLHRNTPVEIKERILMNTARQLGMNKSTHWYQRQKLLKKQPLKLYRKTRQLLDKSVAEESP